MHRTGIAELPLHGGKAPPWLFQRMVKLGREIIRLIIEDNGPEEILRRISDPHWFQSLGCVLGFDWHSSGVTTTVCGALKESIRGREKEWGLVIAGGRGATSRKTPAEIVAAGEKSLYRTTPRNWFTSAASPPRSTTTPFRTASNSITTISFSPWAAHGRLCNKG
jgi:uncharacterized protein